MEMKILSCTVNGKPVQVGYDVRECLLDTLHDRLGLTSVKRGCEVGECGACTVLIDGVATDTCLYLTAWAEGKTIEPADIVAAAAEVWPADGVLVSIDDIQQMVQSQFSVSRQDLVSNKRNKEIAQPRHVAIYLARELTDSTLQEIGRKFGGRSHATVKHSIAWVEERMEQDRLFHDQVMRLRDRLGGS